MISRRQIISRSAGLIFAIFTSNESFLCVDDRSGPLFRYVKGCCHGNRCCAKNAKLPLSSHWHSETEWDIATTVGALTAQMMPVLCENFVKFGPVTPELTGLICKRLV